MKRGIYQLIYFGLPVLIVASSILALNSGEFYVRWTGRDELVAAKLGDMVDQSNSEQWQEASLSYAMVQENWEKVRAWMRLTATVEEVEILDLELAALLGAIEAQDRSQVRIAQRRVLTLWRDITS